MIWVALAAAIAWAVMLFGRGGFWRAADRDEPPAPDLPAWPGVTVIIPARDEAPSIAATVRSLRAQDYAGALRVVVVDDRSTDGTGALARDAGAEVITGTGRAPGWTGKLYALQQGLAAAQPDTRYILFTDADIVHAPDSVRRLVARAERDGLVLTSLMAKLRAVSGAERWFIPAFIYFFQMLYPFRWSNAAGTRTAAAAGGCVLLRRDAFLAAGGLEPIRGRIIDDCALAALMKRQGRIWLGLTDRVVSLRESPSMDPIRRMVARTAYAQLGHSPWLLAGTVLGLTLVFLAPPLLAIFARGPAQWLGAATWAAMALSFVPMLRFYGLGWWRAAALPAVAALYLAFTLDSAWQHHQGRGGMWKGEAAP